LTVALATCAELPDLDPDDRLLRDALDGRGLPVVWDDPGVDWDAFELVVVRNTWDYPAKRDRFLAWADALGDRVRNPPGVLRWSTDKRYLAELAGAGLPVVPTTFAAPGRPPALPDGPVVVKPAIGAGSQDAARHDDPADAAAHVERLHATGRVAMVQPYLEAVESSGETALLYLDGGYSHAVRKGPLLHAEARTDASGLFAEEEIAAREPSAEERAVGDRAIAWVTARFGPLLYARIDLMPGPLVLEVELAEPSLFLGHAPGAAERLAAAITAEPRD
jgi:glutathione synthase/RimK-type ligase-like ATP-grasp enzyme